MSFNGSGTFLINTAGQPVVSGTVISSTAFNALTADLATGLSTAITKDGQTTVTANIPMSTYKFTGLGVGSAATDSANLSQVQSTVTKLLNSVSGADTITATASPTLAAYAAGQMFYFVAAGDNTTSVTLNIDSLGAKAVTRDGSVALAAADIKSGEVIVVVYDGTRFQVVSQLNSAGDARFANVSIASSLYVGGVSTFVGNAGFSANVSIASALSVGGVAAITGATTIGGNLTLSGGTANGVLYLNGSKAATSGSALTFDGNVQQIGAGSTANTAIGLRINATNNAANGGFIASQRNGSDSWLLSDTSAAIGSGTGFVTYVYGANPAIWYTNAAERMRLDSSGNLGLGVTPSAWSIRALQVGSGFAAWSTAVTNARIFANTYYDGAYKYVGTGRATQYEQDGYHAWYTSASGTAGNTISFTQAMTLDASGRLLVGRTTNFAGEALQIDANGVGATVYSALIGNSSTSTSVYNVLRFNQGASGSATGYIGTGGSAVGNNAFANNFVVGTQTSNALVFTTNDTERARITSGGDLLVGTTDTNPVGSDVNGFAVVAGGRTAISRLGGEVLGINRGTDDGTLVSFAQAGSTEGSISVSGATVSYNAFAGSHWSQLQDNSKPDILRGTVMESINELCVWPDEQNERLPKSKISDTAGSKKVYGVFMAWDNDWATTNDMYITAVGAFICRVNGSVTVQEGDLLESNGDGTARVQADDIIRSSTIGKVTSTVKTHQYADGSYCVPTVLYCG